MTKLIFNKNLQLLLQNFLKQYDETKIEEALQLYTNMQQEYLCKTRTSITKIKIYDIYYLKIKAHTITIYTKHDIFHKYGTLNNELKTLSDYNFIKCNQSCIVSLEKIKTIQKDTIILVNNTKLHMSKNCAPKILNAFSGHLKSVY